MNRLLAVLSFTYVLFVLSACDSSIFERKEISASKKAIESHLSDPASVQYRNIVVLDSLDKLSFSENGPYLDEILKQIIHRQQVMISENRASEHKAIIEISVKAMRDAEKIMKEKTSDMNSNVTNGGLKDHVGVCLEFNWKNDHGGYVDFVKDLCLYSVLNKSARCLILDQMLGQKDEGAPIPVISNACK
ncbi:MAG: hypothetical protein Q8O79_00305 [Pseudomonadota bacterium]|nr:hypothetical protein [Pseudomonadota bacterium]